MLFLLVVSAARVLRWLGVEVFEVSTCEWRNSSQLVCGWLGMIQRKHFPNCHIDSHFNQRRQDQRLSVPFDFYRVPTVKTCAHMHLGRLCGDSPGRMLPSNTQACQGCQGRTKPLKRGAELTCAARVPAEEGATKIPPLTINMASGQHRNPRFDILDPEAGVLSSFASQPTCPPLRMETITFRPCIPKTPTSDNSPPKMPISVPCKRSFGRENDMSKILTMSIDSSRTTSWTSLIQARLSSLLRRCSKSTSI